MTATPPLVAESLDLEGAIERDEESLGLIVVGRPFFYSGSLEGLGRIRAAVRVAAARHSLRLVAPSNAPAHADVDVTIGGVVGICLAAASVDQPVLIPRDLIVVSTGVLAPEGVLPPELEVALAALPGFAWAREPAALYLTSTGSSGATLEEAGNTVCASWADEGGYAAISAESLDGLDEIQLFAREA